ncbi:DUF2490 domain-containing protein [Seonamhaeicola sp. ML3]|uniref:DUF2490 domain-containing protein n=1 Tax=Seonamhaeicola sp. ML3 TaxID=2937786 RepID=UPI00200D4986|nr:DUF2490 domain-containing protein [Seonamhaeicola sp. ML3]
MRFIKKLIYTLLFFINITAFSQNELEALGETAIALNHKVSDTYDVNFSLRSRYFLFDENLQYTQQQLDVFHFSTFKLNFIHKLSLGFYYRNRDWFESGSDELRFMQQFAFIKQRLGVRYGHRFRFEQRIFDNFTAFRPRYRFAVDFPLNGEKLDIGETYFIGSTETLLSLSEKRSPLFDQRFTSQIGWQVNQGLKLQSGLEYRLESYNISSKNNLYLLTSAIIKI